jgi:hypothetical protein
MAEMKKDYMPRKGDILSIEGIVKYDPHEGQQYVHLDVDGAVGGDVMIGLKTPYKIVRHAFKVGDLIEFDPLFPRVAGEDVRYSRGIVAAVDGDYLWIKTTRSSELFSVMVTVMAKDGRPAVQTAESES